MRSQPKYNIVIRFTKCKSLFNEYSGLREKNKKALITKK